MAEGVVYLKRDSFARETSVRRIIKPVRGFSKTLSCDWCGQERKHLFQYGVEPDSISGRIHWRKGDFCGIGCMKSYHGD